MQALCEELNTAYNAECVVPVALDVSDSDQCHQVATDVQQRWGTVSVLVNNAGETNATFS